MKKFFLRTEKIMILRLFSSEKKYTVHKKYPAKYAEVKYYFIIALVVYAGNVVIVLQRHE